MRKRRPGHQVGCGWAPARGPRDRSGRRLCRSPRGPSVPVPGKPGPTGTEGATVGGQGQEGSVVFPGRATEVLKPERRGSEGVGTRAPFSKPWRPGRAGPEQTRVSPGEAKGSAVRGRRSHGRPPPRETTGHPPHPCPPGLRSVGDRSVRTGCSLERAELRAAPRGRHLKGHAAPTNACPSAPDGPQDTGAPVSTGLVPAPRFPTVPAGLQAAG